MAYASWSVVFGEQPSASKWNILGTNDASFNDGTGLPNGVTRQFVYSTTVTDATSTTAIPNDTSIPQNTEGEECLSVAITPIATTSVLHIQVNLSSVRVNNKQATAALFQDSTANALAAGSVFISTVSVNSGIYLSHIMAAGTTSSTTFKVRFGSNDGTSTTLESLYGAITRNAITVTEYKA